MAKWALVGATGNLGREILRLMEETQSAWGAPALFSSDISADDVIPYGEEEVTVKQLSGADLSGFDVVIFAAPAAVVAAHAPALAQAGVKVVDTSRAFRADEAVPMVCPPLVAAEKTGHMCLPSAPAMALARVVNALQGVASISHISTTVLEPTGAHGRESMDELFVQSTSLLGGAGAGAAEPFNYPTQVAFNCLPHSGEFVGEDTTSELGMMVDTNRVLKTPVPISATCITVPTFVGTSQSVDMTFEGSVDVKALRTALKNTTGITVIDAPEKGEYSTPFGTAETDDVYISRMRTERANPQVVKMWIAADNLRQSARAVVESV